jgi:hypothetical protein
MPQKDGIGVKHGHQMVLFSIPLLSRRQSRKPLLPFHGLAVLSP